MIHIINKKALTFDDVLISPQYSKISPNKINLKTQLTKKIFLNIPILSAAMDTVTESKLAIALAKEGGIGFIHKNMSTKKQIQEIKRVKNYTNHKNDKIITNPKCVFPSTKILEIKKFIYHNGFFSYPVINKKNELIGIITKRDISHATNLNQKVSSIMTPKNRLITTQKNEDLKFIQKKMYEKKIEKILIINKKNHLLGMITKRDLTHPHKNACKDKYGYLRVGAAISIETTTKHIKTLIEEGVDVLLIDSSHGHSKKVLQLILKIRSKYPTAQIIGGNIATKNAAIDLMKAGVDAVKVGIGPGSICTTRIVTGVGVPQITAISDVAKALKGTNIPVIADGGIRYSGDIAKAIAAGATCVMLGYILAGTKESPGKIKTHKGYSYKSYRGMGSINAMYKGSSDRYYQSNKTIHQLVPEGVEGKIPYKGELKNVLHQQIGGLRSCMRLTGCATIYDLQKKAKFIIISQAGIKENHTHGIMK